MELKIKEVLESMISNNHAFWKLETMKKANQELERLYNQDAKAKLADEIIKSFYEIRKDMKDKLVDYELGYQTIGTEVSKYIKRFEMRGELDE